MTEPVFEYLDIFCSFKAYGRIFVMITYDGASLKMYINARLHKSWSLSAALNPSTNKVYLGVFLKGNEAELMFWTRCLVDQEVTELYFFPLVEVYKRVKHTGLFFGTLAGDSGKLVEWNNRQGFYSRAPKFNNYAYDIYGLIVFDGELFAGSMSGILSKWDHSLDVWMLAAPSPTNNEFNNPLRGLIEYGGDLFGCASSGYDAQALFKWNGTDAWVNVGTSPNVSMLTDTAVLNGNLYVSDASAKLFVWNGLDALTQVLGTPSSPSSTQKTIDKLIVFNGKLYAGTSIGPAGISSVLYEWDGVGASWSIVATSPDWHIYSLAVFNGKLYGGSYRDTSHLYEWNGVDAWIERGSLPNYEGLENLVVFNGSLYGGTNNGNLRRWDGVDSLIFVAHFPAQLFCVSQFTY